MNISKSENVDNSISNYCTELGSYIPRSFLCSICCKLMKDPYAAECGCQFCGDCIKEYLNKGNKYCPVSKDECGKDELKINENVCKDVKTKSKIKKFRVKCPNEGCTFITEMEKMDIHISVCNTISNICPFRLFGCEIGKRDFVESPCNNTNFHFQILLNLNNNFQKTINEMNKKLQSNEIVINKLMADVKEYKNEIECIKEFIYEEVKNQIDEARKEIACNFLNGTLNCISNDQSETKETIDNSIKVVEVDTVTDEKLEAIENGYLSKVMENSDIRKVIDINNTTQSIQCPSDIHINATVVQDNSIASGGNRSHYAEEENAFGFSDIKMRSNRNNTLTDSSTNNHANNIFSLEDSDGESVQCPPSLSFMVSDEDDLSSAKVSQQGSYRDAVISGASNYKFSPKKIVFDQNMQYLKKAISFEFLKPVKIVKSKYNYLAQDIDISDMERLEEILKKMDVGLRIFDFGIFMKLKDDVFSKEPGPHPFDKCNDCRWKIKINILGFNIDKKTPNIDICDIRSCV